MYEIRVTTAEDFGLALQQSRLAEGVSQRELASRVGSTQRYIWELESGKNVTAITRLLESLTAMGALVTVRVPEGTDG